MAVGAQMAKRRDSTTEFVAKKVKEMRGGGWCTWLLPDKAAWGLQGLHLAMSTAVVPGCPQAGLQR